MHNQEPIETITEPAHFRAGIFYKAQTLKIYPDDDPQNPRTEWDNFGSMVCFHRKYQLGDIGHGISEDDFANWSELKEYLIKEKEAIIVLPMYMYDHSGLTVNTTGFSCSWDWGQIGYTYTTRKEILENWGGKKLTKELRQKATDLLVAEVQNYDDYLTGNVYGYVLEDENGNELWSCWGYSGDSAVEQIKSEQLYMHNAQNIAGTQVTVEA